MKFAHIVLLITMTLLMRVPLALAQQTSSAALEQIPVDTMLIEGQAGSPVQRVQSGYFEADAQPTIQVLKESINSQGPHNQVVITTDDPDLFAEVERQISIKGSNALGALTDSEAGSLDPKTRKSFLKKSTGYLKESVRKDPFGVMVTTVLVGTDLWTWVHASQYTPATIAGEVLTSLVFNLGFSLRKGTWSDVNTKVSEKMVTPFLRTIGFKNLNTPRAEGIIKAIANFSITMTVQALRLGFIVAGGSAEIFMGQGSYHYTELLAKAGITAFLVSAAFSFNNFGWSDWIAKINNNEALQIPDKKFLEATFNERSAMLAKFLAYRFHEGRILLTGSQITTAALMSPDTYGYTSWMWIAANGTVGLAAYLHNNLTVKALLAAANNKSVSAASTKVVEVSERFSEKFISFKKLFGRSALTCRSVFAN